MVVGFDVGDVFVDLFDYVCVFVFEDGRCVVGWVGV